MKLKKAFLDPGTTSEECLLDGYTLRCSALGAVCPADTVAFAGEKNLAHEGHTPPSGL